MARGGRRLDDDHNDDEDDDNDERCVVWGGASGSTRGDEDCVDVVDSRDGVGGVRKEDPGRGDDDDGIGDGDDDDVSPLNKQRYGLVIDYLKAKYAWGMMIDDCDKTRAAQGCRKKKRRGREEGGKGEASGADNRDDGDGEEEEGGGGRTTRTKNYMVRGL